MKYEWRKQEKDLYLPSTKPVLVKIPKQKFIMIDGVGNPNEKDFATRIGALYSLAYTIKMLPRKGYIIDDYFDYTVYPLEGVWDLTEKGRKQDVLDKNELVYTIMIQQPTFITKQIFEQALEIAKNKKKNPLLKELYFEEYEEGLVVQALHVGSYDSEPITFNKMKEYINENNLEIVTYKHREIYLSDNRKTSQDKLKTVLRYQVRKK